MVRERQKNHDDDDGDLFKLCLKQNTILWLTKLSSDGDTESDLVSGMDSSSSQIQRGLCIIYLYQDTPLSFQQSGISDQGDVPVYNVGPCSQIPGK